MKTNISRCLILLTAATLAAAAPDSKPDLEGTVHVPAFDLPPSGLVSAETRAVLVRQTREFAQLMKECPIDLSKAEAKDVIALRACTEKRLYPAMIARHRARYPVAIKPQTIAGVQTEIITPIAGIAKANRQRVLINLHGGGFITGGRWGGEIESIPIAAVGKIKIVSVDYRMAPEYRFPAASEDVAAVYKMLLKEYKPENIGIYGCSAGGMLTAQAVAWFQKERLPAPGAIGIFCAGAYPWDEGDSDRMEAAIAGTSAPWSPAISYIPESERRNPLAYPGLSREVMARFPASLLISATRDGALSNAAATHSQLVRLGVTTQLHVWEGLGHAFFFEPDFPESREAYDVTVRFFAEHLSKRTAHPPGGSLR